MNFQEWTKIYEPVVNQNGNNAIIDDLDNCIGFETFGKDFTVVNNSNPDCIWTVIEGEEVQEHPDEPAEPQWVLVPGKHFVNRLYYVIATQACLEDIEVIL